MSCKLQVEEPKGVKCTAALSLNKQMNGTFSSPPSRSLFTDMHIPAINNLQLQLAVNATLL